MDVDESWTHDKSGTVENLKLRSNTVGRGAFGVVSCALQAVDLAIDDCDVGHLIDVLGRIDDAAALENQRAHAGPPLAFSASSGRPPESRYSTAIRTATPFVT